MVVYGVWVVMGNDYPEAVFSSNKLAQEYCDRKKKENEKDIKRGTSRTIYYRPYGFMVDAVPPGNIPT